MEQASQLLSSLLTGMRRHTAEGITSSRIDSLLTLAERLLRILTILLAVSGGAGDGEQCPSHARSSE